MRSLDDAHLPPTLRNLYAIRNGTAISIVQLSYHKPVSAILFAGVPIFNCNVVLFHSLFCIINQKKVDLSYQVVDYLPYRE